MADNTLFPTEQPQQQEADNKEQNAMIAELTTALELTQKFVPAAITAIQTTKARLSVFTTILDDETDEKAEAALVKARTTFEQLQNYRKNITAPLDALKSRLMAYEKEISIDPKDTASPYNKVKALRNIYNNAKVQAAEEKRLAALKMQKKNEEIIRIKSEIAKNIVLQVANTVSRVNEDINQYLNKFTVENFDVKAAQLNARPTLKPEIWVNWFDIHYNKELVSPEEYKAIVDEMGNEGDYTYEKVSEMYVAKATPVIESYKSKLPGLREKLIDIQKKSETDAESAADAKRKLDEERELQQRQVQAQNDADMKAQQEKAEREAQEARLENSFNTHAVLSEQTTAAAGGKTVNYAILNCDPKDIVSVLSQLMFTVFTHPKFKGIVQTDKAGFPKYEVLPDGKTERPVYEKWVETLFSFYADNCSHNVPGIDIVKCYSTVQKKR